MNKTNPTVAVIIPTYNRSKFLVQSLESVLGQTRPPDEVIVVDDGSTDNTAKMLKRFDGRIAYLCQENAGKSAALNLATAALGTDYLWIMDDDDVALPDALERHLVFLSEHPEFDFSYSSYYSFAGDVPPREFSSSQLLDEGVISDEELFISAMMVFPFLMNGMLVPVECYRRVGLFNEILKRDQDYEMILRLTRAFRGGRLPAPTFCRRFYTRSRGDVRPGKFSSDAERDTIYCKYDRIIFKNLRQSVSLHEYLPRGAAQEHSLTDKLRNQALLQRASIMARHGLFAESLADIDTALSGRGKDAELSAEEQRILSQMLNTQVWHRAEHYEFPAALGRFLRKLRARQALAACAAGLGWGVSGELRAGRYANSVKTLRHLQRLIGFKGAPELALALLRRRYQPT